MKNQVDRSGGFQLKIGSGFVENHVKLNKKWLQHRVTDPMDDFLNSTVPKFRKKNVNEFKRTSSSLYSYSILNERK